VSNKYKLIVMLLMAVFVLQGFHSKAFAEQLNKSVNECISNPESCSQPESSREKTPGAEAGKVGIGVWDTVKMLTATAFVIALLYLMLKFINSKSRSLKSSQIVENLGGTSLGSNKSIQVVKVGKQLLIVGVGEDIRLLKEIQEKDEYEDILAEYNRKTEQLIQPSDIVTRVIKRTKAKKEINVQKSFKSELKSQLEDMKKERNSLYKELQKGQNKNE
jgi:flagellar protein FliO/FliZ